MLEGTLLINMFIICTRKSDHTVEGLVLGVRDALNFKLLSYYFLYCSSSLFFYIFIISPKFN